MPGCAVVFLAHPVLADYASTWYFSRALWLNLVGNLPRRAGYFRFLGFVSNVFDGPVGKLMVAPGDEGVAH